MNSFYHSFMPGFNWVYVIAPLTLVVMAVLGYLFGARICKRRYRHKSINGIGRMIQMTDHMKVVHWGISVTRVECSDIGLDDDIRTVAAEVKQVSGKCPRGTWRVRYDRATNQYAITSKQIATVRNDNGTRSAKMVKTSPTIGTFFAVAATVMVAWLGFYECGAGLLQLCCNHLGRNESPFWALVVAGFFAAVAMVTYGCICYAIYMAGRNRRQTRNEAKCFDAGYYALPQVDERAALSVVLKPYCAVAAQNLAKAGEVVIVSVVTLVAALIALGQSSNGKRCRKGGRRLVSRKSRSRH